jgi:hypothetical protein
MGRLEIIKFVVMIVILSNQQDGRFLRDVLDTDQIMELLVEFFQQVVMVLILSEFRRENPSSALLPASDQNEAAQ